MMESTLEQHLEVLSDEHILIPRAKIGNPELIREIKKRSEAVIEDLPIYDTHYEAYGFINYQEEFEQGKTDYVMFTSASTVRGFAQAAKGLDFPKYRHFVSGNRQRQQRITMACRHLWQSSDTGGDGGACKRKEEDMVKITYISHSCFAVELEHSVLVFDYYQGELPLWNPEKTIYVFVSHRHYDHFSKEIFRWTEQYPKIKYILSDDISEASYDASEICRSDLTRIAPNQTETIGNCVIETFRSTDEGVAFLVSCEEKLFYHAGDLNWWHWKKNLHCTTKQ